MVSSEIRQHIHKLVDEANENQLDAVLEMLEPSSSRYTQEELNSFYQHVKLFEESGSKGYSVTESHEFIRNKYKQHGL
jgi:hypothetical protein